MEEIFRSNLDDLPSDGLRLKKFRKSIFDILLKRNPQQFDENVAKEEFQQLLENMEKNHELMIENGFIKRIINENSNNKKRSREGNGETSSSKKNKSESEQQQQQEQQQSQSHQENDVESENKFNVYEQAIITLLNEIPSEGIRLKKFRQTILDQFAHTTSDLSALKDQFATSFDNMCKQNYAKEENGMVTRLGDKIIVKKMKKLPLPSVDKEIAKKEMWKYGEQAWQDGTLDQEYLSHNPDGITRLFCGNLKKTITEEQLHNAINGIVFIKWMTDKATREFYGSTFLEMKDPAAAAAAVLLDKTKLLGRPLKIYYCPPRPGDIWPPENSQQRGGPSSSSSNSNSSSSNAPPRALHDIRPKPPGCRKLFCGNLSYSIDDEVLCNFFKDCGELTGLRWLTRQGTGEFRGCAFVEFATTEAADKAIRLNGEMLLERPIRLDWD